MEKIKKVEVPEGVALGVDGPAWIKFKTRIKGKYRKNLVRYRQVGLKMAALATKGIVAEEQGRQLNGEVDMYVDTAIEFTEYDEDVIPAIFHALIVDWNWLDEETGELLPLTVESVQDELDHVQTEWLATQIYEILNQRAAEGNSKSDKDSSPTSKESERARQTG